MRRILAFVMCVSGFTLTFSWARADEPAVAAAADEADPSTELAPARPVERTDPPSRPAVVRTEPGSHRQEQHEVDRSQGDQRERFWAERRRRIDELRDKYTSPEFIQQQQERLEQLEEKLEQLADAYSGPALEQARQYLESRLARAEKLLENLGTESAHAADDSTDDTSSERTIQGRLEQLRIQLQAAAERYTGEALERTREALERQIEHLEEVQQHDEARLRTWLRLYEIQSEFGRPQIVEERIEALSRYYEHLAEHPEHAERPGRAQAEIALIERFLAEVKERRERDAARRHDAVERPPQRHHDNDELHERLRHIHAAIEHLEAADLPDIAHDLRRRAQELQHQTEVRRDMEAHERNLIQQQRKLAERRNELKRQEAIARFEAERAERRATGRERAGAEHRETEAARDLSEQLRDLRREVRRLRQEVQEIREAAPKTDPE